MSRPEDTDDSTQATPAATAPTEAGHVEPSDQGAVHAAVMQLGAMQPPMPPGAMHPMHQGAMHPMHGMQPGMQPMPMHPGAIPPGMPMPSGAPYRLPTPPVEPTLDLGPYMAAPTKKPRPVIGPALSVFAVLLWTFVVAGQFATSWMMGAPLNQEVALGLIVFTTFMTWVASLRRSRIAAPPRQNANFVARAIGVAALAGLFFFVILMGAAIFGNAGSSSHDFLIAFTLVILSLVAAIAGPRLTSPTPPERSHGQRFMLVAMWIVGTLLTLVAGADLAANG